MIKDANISGLESQKENEIVIQTDTNYDNYEYVHYIYETPETGLFESTTILEGLEFASIECLREEIGEQVMKDFSEEKWEKASIDSIKGRNNGSTVICKEGAFYWNNFNNEYEWVGGFHQKKIHHLKRLEVTQETIVSIDEKVVILDKRHYTVVAEGKAIVGKSAFEIELYTIELNDGQTITVPNNPGIFKVYEIDFALIDNPAEADTDALSDVESDRGGTSNKP